MQYSRAQPVPNNMLDRCIGDRHARMSSARFAVLCRHSGGLTFFCVLHAAAKEVLSVLVHEMDKTTFHTPRQQNAISIFHHLNKTVARSFYYRIERLSLIACPVRFVRRIDEIISKYHTHVIEFETLSRVDAANLIHSPRVISPKAFLW